MPTSIRETLLARYHYDPLDRLVDSTPFEQSAIRRYYCKARLSTELQGAVQRTIVQHDDHLLAQQQREGGEMAATLLATDQQRSVLNALDATEPYHLAYTPYGHRPMENGLLSLLGFNGERPDPVTGHYHLGNGYRQFNPVLMRFNSPDSWSPFGSGGLNAYTYCLGDPVNGTDPSGRIPVFLKSVLRSVGIMRKPLTPQQATAVTKLTSMEHGIFYKEQNIGRQYKPSVLETELDNVSTNRIKKYISAIHKDTINTDNSINKTLNELNVKKLSEQDKKTIEQLVNPNYAFHTIEKVSTAKDKSVVQLQKAILHNSEKKKAKNFIDDILETQSNPTEINSGIRTPR
ncbi:hypothetical protein PS914_06334 [Pseudomonas fluorescens]|uniref:RHS repeat-associated core domain-containing protein n=1 Tax=Pseudomonas fluorescens TaxID=294 RepID=UPI0012425411|nr:RHS repeat-associated core domain-containing protein [Pseudomonas fluorescens]VVQ19595.1 hypothetical protein PS914_06334 [Pseudomonas fluorescens]